MKRPHVIVLLADQLRRDVLGCYGGEYGASANLDALAGESVLLRSHTINCPLCVPSRVSMITGVHPHVHGAIVNAWDKEEQPYGTCRDRPTLYELLGEGGYRVEHLGVHHLRCDPPLERRHERVHFSAPVREHAAWLTQRGVEVDLSACRSPCLDYVGGRPVARMYSNANTVPWPGEAEDFLDSWLARRMVEAVERADPDQPLAFMGNFWLPHPPLSCPEPHYSMYDPDALALPDNVGKWCDGHSPMHLIHLPGHVAAGTTMDGWRRAWAVYLGMVRLLDECVGRVIDALKRRGFWENALVIFTSDHGEMLGRHGLFQKMCMYEDAVRVPMLIKPPGGGAGVREQLTQHLDLAATICDYCDLPAEPSERGASRLRSRMPAGGVRSFRSVVEDTAAPGWEEVFAEFNGNSGRGFQQRAVITATHKYIYNHGYEPELYDLRHDQAETQNLCQAESPPPEAGQLRERLRRWMIQTNDYIRMPD